MVEVRNLIFFASCSENSKRYIEIAITGIYLRAGYISISEFKLQLKKIVFE